MVVDIVDVANAIPQATGTPVAPVTGQPTVTFDPTTGPTITIPAGAAGVKILVTPGAPDMTEPEFKHRGW